jgi:hypothetical protein
MERTMADLNWEFDPAPATAPARLRNDRAVEGSSRGHSDDWKRLLMADLCEQAARRAWGPTLMAVGFTHLGFFLVCQALYTSGVRTESVWLSLWGAEVASVFLAIRVVAGRGWAHESPAVGLILRVWITFLILSLNAAMLNSLTGWSIDWFKLVWCSLASFGFATMAWLFGLRFLIPAFQMYFTSLLILRFPLWAYAIHGVSWCVTLQYLGFDLKRIRKRLVRREPSAWKSMSVDSEDLECANG